MFIYNTVKGILRNKRVFDEVDANDPAFSNPTKYIGPIYDHAQTQVLQAEKGWVFK